jgi:hypothetical protein
VDERTLEWLDALARALLWAALAVLVLAVIGAVAVATSETSLPGLDVLQRENRGLIAIAALGGGIAGAGVLAGLGGILRLMVADRRDRG